MPPPLPTARRGHTRDGAIAHIATGAANIGEKDYIICFASPLPHAPSPSSSPSFPPLPIRLPTTRRGHTRDGAIAHIATGAANIGEKDCMFHLPSSPSPLPPSLPPRPPSHLPPHPLFPCLSPLPPPLFPSPSPSDWAIAHIATGAANTGKKFKVYVYDPPPSLPSRIILRG